MDCEKQWAYGVIFHLRPLYRTNARTKVGITVMTHSSVSNKLCFKMRKILFIFLLLLLGRKGGNLKVN